MDWMFTWPGPAEAVWGIASGIATIAFWVVLITVVVHVVKRSPPSGGRNALAVLEERYARGEIDRDEFLERRSVLQADPRS